MIDLNFYCEYKELFFMVLSCSELVTQTVQWFNENQGFCMVLLTMSMVICSIVSCRIAAHAIREQNRPHVVVSPCFIDHEYYFGVSLRNCGFSTAYDINFKWDTAPICPWPSMATSETSKFLREPIGSLRAGVGYKTFLGVIGDLKKQNADLVYRGTITYKDSTGKRYKEDIVVDFHMFDKRGIIPDDNDSDSVKALMRITEQLRGICQYTNHILSKDRMASIFRPKECPSGDVPSSDASCNTDVMNSEIKKEPVESNAT